MGLITCHQTLFSSPQLTAKRITMCHCVFLTDMLYQPRLCIILKLFIFLGRLMALISPGFQLDGFPCIIGASKATANATVEDEDKGKLRKAQLS